MMKIGTVVNHLGLPASTIRYYEKIGLIKPLARAGNSRYLDDNDVAELKFIQMSQAVGFSINEIKELLTAFSTEEVNTGKCNQLVKEKIIELEKRIHDMAQMKSALSQAIDCQCSSLQACVEDLETFGCS